MDHQWVSLVVFEGDWTLCVGFDKAVLCITQVLMLNEVLVEFSSNFSITSTSRCQEVF